MQIASMAAMRKGIVAFGPANTTVLGFETLMDSKALFLTPNTSSVYMTAWLDLRDGPMVIEAPPNVLGFIDDAWFHYVVDFGNAGPDKGRVGGTSCCRRFRFFEEVDEVVQTEPLDGQDPEILGLLASIGIRKGSAFAPDARMRRILEQAADVGAATVRTLAARPRGDEYYLYPGEGRGRHRSSAAATGSSLTVCACSPPAPSSTSTRPASRRRGAWPRSAPAPSTRRPTGCGRTAARRQPNVPGAPAT